MKYNIYIIIFSFSIGFVSAQGVRNLDDRALTSQHRRMVYEGWGEWRPYPNYTWFGIQTRFSYAMVWGWLSPRRNRDYKEGADIRPLSPDGEETMRQVEVSLQKRNAGRIAESMEGIYEDNVKDYQHWTPYTSDADPLWLLYYRRMLRRLDEFPDRPSNAMEWGFDSERIYNRIVERGEEDKLLEKLEICKDRYEYSRTIPMPRGKRILMYHATLLEWRELMAVIANMNNSFFNKYHFTEKLDAIQYANIEFNHQTDKEIIEGILQRYNYDY